ncbi:GNAT family acetyltransferase [Microbacterium imperiale]|uniref:GNAT family acetyltransferase n=1 Tax=Microbacterium imperiale TaxID=33884 RepID=A0A9W6HF02_9MICO|nr:GNAT family acetyltransferase [Microbacterium imperiale]MBP2420075.1 ribosomal protein S18 acetylase RimI-like enzyme [Microbacterium imperiale]MDS0198062.1 GNAT family acetyltransferase [Microbacterium imperiale]BFE40416.1 GNAT family acetyltransferase [Microbacterium imperiale]GLJ78608.1 GNAT family acetyltransferase [Microbacterium imperiale]
MTITLRAFAPADEDEVVALWHETGLTRPWNDPRADIRRKLTVQPELFLVAVDEPADGTAARIVGTVMAGYDGHRGWLYYLASAPTHRERGVGRKLVAEAERLLEAMGCPKVQVMVRPENDVVRGFYTELGYEPFSTWTTGKRIVVDGPGGPA